MDANSRGVVLVTGASTGIGEACALRLAGLGFRVYAGVRKTTDAEALLSKRTGDLRPLMLDVTNEEQVKAAAETVRAETGGSGLYGLVNNAGIAIGGPLEFVPLDEFRKQLEVNLVGQLAVLQAFIPQLRTARGRIVNMGSIAGRFSAPYQGPYAISKFGLEAMTDALRLELQPWGIHVSVIEPGNINTPIWKKSLSEWEETAKGLPAAMWDLYGPAIRMMRKYISSKDPKVYPETVAEAVVHALTAPRPKTRYLVGSDARSLVWIERLPDRLRDWLVLSRLRRGTAASLDNPKS